MAYPAPVAGNAAALRQIDLERQEADSDDICLENFFYNFGSTFSDAKYAMLGIATSFVAIPVINYLTDVITSLFITTIEEGDVQDVISIFQGIENISWTVLKIAAKVAFIGYATIIGPVLEEALFRGAFYDITKGVEDWIWGPDANSTAQRVTRVVLNGLLFGACHLSPFQGWVNLPIFIATSLMGIVFAGLREVTGNTQASSVAHMANNCFALIHHGIL